MSANNIKAKYFVLKLGIPFCIPDFSLLQTGVGSTGAWGKGLGGWVRLHGGTIV